MTYTKETLAALLNGREYGDEITAKEEAEAKASGLVVVFGTSDDLMELRGCIDDEAGSYNTTTHLLDAKGVLPDWDQISDDGESAVAKWLKRKPLCKTIKSTLGKAGWVFETDIPHATFDVLEDAELYGKGIVFSIADL